MALLQVHQAKALRDLHEGGHDPQVLQELRAATDLALWATKVTAWSVGRVISTLVVQERHLSLCLAELRDNDKVRFLNSPVSQTGLFGYAVENFAQESEAISHILLGRSSVASTPPPAAPKPARRQRRPLGLPPLPRRSNSLHPSGAMEPVVSGVPQPVQGPVPPADMRSGF